MDLYRRTLREIGLDDAAVADNVDQCWVWRNVFVAETDAEAERIAVPAFEAMHAQRTAMREHVYREQGVSIVPMPPPGTRAGGADGGRAFADLWLAGDRGGEAGRGRGDRCRRRDHAVPAWPDGVRRCGAEPDAVHAQGGAGVLHSPAAAGNLSRAAEEVYSAAPRTRSTSASGLSGTASPRHATC